MLDVLQLSCRRGERLLFDDLSFQLDTGTLLHVRGCNGSGKTTLLRALCGLLRTDQGEIRWRGQTLQSLAEDYYQDVLYFGHLNGLKGDLTAVENLRVAARLAGYRCGTGAIDQALARIGLGGYGDLPCRMLSQGQKKRVALARLLLTNAPLWILDEPFTALDVDAVAWLQDHLTAHVSAGGLVVLTTHQEVALTSGQIQRVDLDNQKTAPMEVPC